MEERTRRIGHNEALYRQVNERIEEVNETFGALSGTFSIVCECGDLNCMEMISVSRDAYEQTRRDPRLFIVLAGHDAPDTERVVDRAPDGSYAVVEKEPPEATRLAEDTHPRR